MSNILPPRRQTALLVSVYQSPGERAQCIEHLEELALLADTYGVDTASKIPCVVRKYDSALYLGSGKINELSKIAADLGVDMVIFDDEISPAQQRNLEKLFSLPVMDRTGVILEVFAQRAQTREARLQVALAKLKYEAPRLKRLWTHLSRQQGTSGAGGGGAYLKGEGEKQIEVDRRILKDKIDTLQKEIDQVKAHRGVQRTARVRSRLPIFAIVGYTNAGKSTLLNKLTDAGVFVEDKLFATLDTTTRQFTLSNQQQILLIDTVGFIRKLPHLLVVAFRSTLEEAIEADILLHLVDASHPMAEEQAATTFQVLQELGAGTKPIITIFNKIDKEIDSGRLQRLKMSYPKNVVISALSGAGFDQLEQMILQQLKNQRSIVTAKIPQADYHFVAEVLRVGKVLSQEYQENEILIQAEIPWDLHGRIAPYLTDGHESA